MPFARKVLHEYGTMVPFDLRTGSAAFSQHVSPFVLAPRVCRSCGITEMMAWTHADRKYKRGALALTIPCAARLMPDKLTFCKLFAAPHPPTADEAGPLTGDELGLPQFTAEMTKATKNKPRTLL